MSDGTDILRTVVGGLITGGTSAATTFLTVFRSIKQRVGDLETKVGSSSDPKTGLYLAVSTLEDSLRRLKRDIDEWEDHPPDWAKRLVQRAKVNASSDLNTVVDIESRVDTRLRSFHERLTSIESDQGQTTAMTREEYLEDSARRAREMGEIREEVAAVNGLLKGVLVALGKDPDIG
jgi:chromosome segregation ATPase